jgi:hypothetical protein
MKNMILVLLNDIGQLDGSRQGYYRDDVGIICTLLLEDWTLRSSKALYTIPDLWRFLLPDTDEMNFEFYDTR